MFVCSNCSKEYSTPVKFCSDCGGQTVEKKYFCTACMIEYDGSNKFCNSCGKPVEYCDAEFVQKLQSQRMAEEQRLQAQKMAEAQNLQEQKKENFETALSILHKTLQETAQSYPGVKTDGNDYVLWLCNGSRSYSFKDYPVFVKARRTVGRGFAPSLRSVQAVLDWVIDDNMQIRIINSSINKKFHVGACLLHIFACVLFFNCLIGGAILGFVIVCLISLLALIGTIASFSVSVSAGNEENEANMYKFLADLNNRLAVVKITDYATKKKPVNELKVFNFSQENTKNIQVINPMSSTLTKEALDPGQENVVKSSDKTTQEEVPGECNVNSKWLFFVYFAILVVAAAGLFVLGKTIAGIVAAILSAIMLVFALLGLFTNNNSNENKSM